MDTAAKGYIGVVDSGVGGLSVLRYIHQFLPEHPTIYIADEGHLPYGPRPQEEIRSFVMPLAQFLLARGASVLVIACNSASAAALYTLRQQYPNMPIVGMEPAVKPAVKATKSGVIGVLTTQATANGILYQRVLERFADGCHVITQVTPELVQLAEQQSGYTAEGQAILYHYLQPLLDVGADHVALACTHFPFLVDAMRRLTGDSITYIDPAPAVARQVARVWPKHIPPAKDYHTYFTTGDPDHLQHALKTLIQVDTTVTALNFERL